MNYLNIKRRDIANGLGVRVSVFVCGCTHHCKGCFNPETWNFNAGEPFSDKQLKLVLDFLQPDYVQGLTMLGGEPMEPENQPAVYNLIKEVKSKYPQKDIWIYSGYLYEELTNKNSKVSTNHTLNILSLCDVLVDGEFVLDKKNLRLKFRGSQNQRIIDVKKSLATGTVCLYNVD